jgi:hypothetical protein
VDISSDLNKNKYPTDVTVNVGNDADNEWQFKGKGYGSFGKQTFFEDGTEKSFLYFQNTTFRNDAKILVPRNATIITSEMTIEGGTGNYDEEYFVSVDYYGNKLNYYKSNGDGSWGSAQQVIIFGAQLAWRILITMAILIWWRAVLVVMFIIMKRSHQTVILPHQ